MASKMNLVVENLDYHLLPDAFEDFWGYTKSKLPDFINNRLFKYQEMVNYPT